MQIPYEYKKSRVLSNSEDISNFCQEVILPEIQRPAEKIKCSLGKLRTHDYSTIRNLVVRSRLIILSLLAIMVIYLQIAEIRHEGRITLFIVAELFLSIVLFIGLYLLIEVLLRSIASETRAVNILKSKQKVSTDLAAIQNWDELGDQIIKSIGAIVPLDYASVFINNPNFGGLEMISDWSLGTYTSDMFASPLNLEICRRCAMTHKTLMHSSKICPQIKNPVIKNYAYRLPLIFGNEFIGLVYLKQLSDSPLTAEQAIVLNEISNNLAAALNNGLQRKTLLEIKMAESAAVERANVSRDIHDSISQNLGYLRMKLEQVVCESPGEEIACPKSEMEKMHIAASEAYELVRTNLKALRMKKSPLSGMIQEQAKALANHRDLIFVVEEEGMPRNLPAEVIRQIYFVYREAICNIAKHASAKSFDTHIAWEKDGLKIIVRDDGKGFDPNEVLASQHFGLRIMGERIEAVNGTFDLQAAPGTGTQIEIHIPLS